MNRILFKVFIVCLVSACQSQKQTLGLKAQPKKVTVPADMIISADIGPEVKEIQVQWFEKGKALYKIHCGDCHGIFTKGKDGVPNFTRAQIDNYNITAIANPEQHSAIKKMSTEQFNYVITYLRLRKIS